MAKDLAELRSNRWLPRALTKKESEIAQPKKEIITEPKVSPTNPHQHENGNHKANGSSPSDMSTEDAELYCAMEKFLQKLKV